MIVSLIELIPLCIFGFFIGYLAMLSVLAAVHREGRCAEAASQRRFAVIVPAHNEEITITRTLQSLRAIKYPENAFDVIVIADNCSDGTAELSRKLGAVVLERCHPTLRGKGYALRWGFDLLLVKQPSYDGFVVIDADSIVSENFLSVMNCYLERGSQAIQSSDLVAPKAGAWSSEITRLGFTLYNYVRPLGRRLIGCSAGIRGNGMCFSASTLRAVPWNAYSLTEDLEYGLLLLLNGITVDFAPEARVLAIMPVEAQNAQSQRARWEGGRLPVIRAYAPRLLRFAVNKHSFKAFDACVELMTPPFLLLFGVATIVAGCNVLLWQLGVQMIGPFVLPSIVLVFLAFVHVFIGLFAARADRSLYRALLFIPRYAVWKVLFYANLARRRSDRGWIRTTREHVALSERIKKS